MVITLIAAVTLLAFILLAVKEYRNGEDSSNSLIVIVFGFVVILFTTALGFLLIPGDEKEVTYTLVEVNGEYITEDNFVVYEQEGRQRTIELPEDVHITEDSGKAEVTYRYEQIDGTWLIPLYRENVAEEYFVRTP